MPVEIWFEIWFVGSLLKLFVQTTTPKFIFKLKANKISSADRPIRSRQDGNKKKITQAGFVTRLLL